jgi:TonB family protein
MSNPSAMGVAVLTLMVAAAARADAPTPSSPPAPGPLPPAMLAPLAVITAPVQRIAGPSADDMARFYPERASRMGISGVAMLRCVITTLGRLSACAVLSEDPAGQGFGAAALQLVAKFKYAPPPAPLPHDLRIKFVLPKN